MDPHLCWWWPVGVEDAEEYLRGVRRASLWSLCVSVPLWVAALAFLLH